MSRLHGLIHLFIGGFMKVKDLIEKLKKLDQEAIVVSQEYDGGCHTIHDIAKIIEHNEGQQIYRWDLSSASDSVDDETGMCITKVVYIN